MSFLKTKPADMEENVKERMLSLGFSKEIENIMNGKCAFCGSTKTAKEDFVDELSYKDFGITGICQKCQDKIYNEDY